MRKFDESEMVDRLKKGGSITPAEMAYLRASLQTLPQGADLYNLARAFALAASPTRESIQLVEQYFVPESDDWDLKGIVYALCDYWKLTENYVDKLLFFAKPESWQQYPSAAIASLGSLGAYLHETHDRDTLRELLRTLEMELKGVEKRDPSVDLQHLGCIYKAIDVAVRGREAIVDHIREKKMPAEIDPKIVAKATRKLSRT